MKNKFVIICIIALCCLLNIVKIAYAVETNNILDFIDKNKTKNEKIAYLTFDDGPSIYSHKIMDVLNEYEVPGIFFVLGKNFAYLPDTDEILKRMIKDGHYIALHTMTHDKSALYWSEKSPQNFRAEMLELRTEIKNRTGHVANLCRAPYGKKGHFKVAHHQAVEQAGLYCIDWHVDSRDWEKRNADQIYAEVASGLKKVKDNHEIVLLFHEYQRTVDVLPSVINLLLDQGYTFKPYVDGKIIEGLN